MSLSTLTGVSAGYGGCEVLREVSLEVKAGEAWAVLGPNGSGKTTLAKVVVGLLRPMVGSVRVGSLAAERASPSELARAVAWVPQQTPEDLDFSALEVVLMGRAPHLGPLGLTGEKDEQLAREALAAFDVTALAGRRVSALSGGERRRVFLARALVQQAPLLVLDEPTAFLDVRHQVETLHLVRQRVSQSLGVLAVLHDVSLASRFSTHVALLAKGRVAAQGPVSEVLTTARLSEVYGIAMERRGDHTFEPRWPT